MLHELMHLKVSRRVCPVKQSFGSHLRSCNPLRCHFLTEMLNWASQICEAGPMGCSPLLSHEVTVAKACKIQTSGYAELSLSLSPTPLPLLHDHTHTRQAGLQRPPKISQAFMQKAPPTQTEPHGTQTEPHEEPSMAASVR